MKTITNIDKVLSIKVKIYMNEYSANILSYSKEYNVDKICIHILEN